MTVLRLRPSRSGARARCAWTAAVCLLAAVVALAEGQAAEPVKGGARIATDGGFGRLVFKLDEAVPASVRLNWPIVVITFAKPVEVSVDRLNAGAPDYISAARIDPDGTAIRIALARKLKINTIPAAERLYVDLLPEDWAGVLPGLPPEVIEELAKRARDADRILERERAADKRRTPPSLRLKVATQPTFTRYVFDLPGDVDVVPRRDDDRLTLAFDHAIKWDLADALTALPRTLQSIDAETARDATTVRFVLSGAPDVRTFREDRSLIVDVGHDASGSQALARPVLRQVAGAAAPHPAGEPPAAKPDVPAIAPPETVPAAAETAVKDDGLPPLIDVPASAPPAPKPARTAAKETKEPPVPAAAARAQAAPEPSPSRASLAAEARAPSPPAATPPAVSAPDVQPAAPKPAGKATSPLPKADPSAPVVVAVHRSDDVMRLSFPFASPVPAAAFLRADTLWLVFDTAVKIDVNALQSAARGNDTIRGAASTRGAEGEAIVHVKFKRPQLVSLDTDGTGWSVLIGNVAAVKAQPLAAMRSVTGKNRSEVVIPFEGAAKVHRIGDPDGGGRLLVVTAPGPARGFLRPQNFVELRVLDSAHGVVIHPIADDVAAAIAAHTITLSRPGGLALSTAAAGEFETASGLRSTSFDTQLWGFDRKTRFEERQSELIRRAAAAPASKRHAARLNLARFYLARSMAAEARAVLDVARADQSEADDVTGSVLSAIADVMMYRPEDALKELSKPHIGNQLEAPVWRAIAYARQGRWPEARTAFKNIDAAMTALPMELQRVALMEALRSNIAAGDFNAAAGLVNEFETLGVTADLAPAYSVLLGRLDQALGRNADALANYRRAIASADRRAAAEGRLREIELRSAIGEMPRKETIVALETLTTAWRGDETETEGLKRLARLYTEEGRYRDAFHVMRTALLAHPNSNLTRQIQDAAAATFDSLFLSDKGDSLPPIEALALFYDYRELTPIGRRGDEMIRRLADRLVAVDLLDQAAELLQHQVDHRLQGAARAQIATRLAVVYLMNRKPERALAALRSTRVADLANEIRDQRLLIEARALSDVGRHGLALEVVASVKGRETTRLRADILWSSKRWREAAEQIELLHGERWKQFSPLSESERFDILRAAIGYSLAEEAIGLERFREKYAAKMAEGPDARAFDVVTAPIGPASGEFQDVARWIAGIDTLDAFLRDMRARYPDVAAPKSAGEAAAPAGNKVEPATTGAAVPAGR